MVAATCRGSAALAARAGSRLRYLMHVAHQARQPVRGPVQKDSSRSDPRSLLVVALMLRSEEHRPPPVEQDEAQ